VTTSNSVEYWRTETERLRSAAKWLAAALAGVASVLVAGIPLTGLGQLSPASGGVRLSVAITSLAVALGCVGWMIQATVAIFSTRWITLSDIEMQEFLERYIADAAKPGVLPKVMRFIRRPRPTPSPGEAVTLLADVDANKATLFGHVVEERAQLFVLLREVNREAASALNARRATASRLERVDIVRAAVDVCLGFVNYQYIRGRFERLTHRLLAVGTVAALAIATFAYAASPSSRQPTCIVRVSTNGEPYMPPSWPLQQNREPRIGCSPHP
jgi:hypothetical protein